MHRARIVATHTLDAVTLQRDGADAESTPEIRIHVEADIGDETAARAALERAVADVLRQLNSYTPHQERDV